MSQDTERPGIGSLCGRCGHFEEGVIGVMFGHRCESCGAIDAADIVRQPFATRGGQHMSQDTERLSAASVAWYAGSPGCEYSDDLNIVHDIVLLAREVQASRKLMADLRATHATAHSISLDGVIRMIGEAGL